MLRAFAGEGAAAEFDWAESYKTSDQFNKVCRELEAIPGSADETKKIMFEKTFATSKTEQIKLMNRRVTTVYKRSPAYNLTRLLISLLYSFLIGSVFLRNTGARSDGENTVWSENQVDGLISTIFLSLIIIGVTSISKYCGKP